MIHPLHRAGTGTMVHRAMVHARHRTGLRARRTVPHALHGAVIHGAHVVAAHAHVLHGRERTLAEGRNLGSHALTRRERGPGLARAVNTFADERVRAHVGRRDDRIIGFGGTELELIDLDRPHVQAVRCDDRHRQARNADVEGRHGRCVDEAEPDPLAGLEQRGPVVARPMTVDQISVGRSGHVGDVSRVHPHLAPHQPLLERLILAREQAGQALALAVEIARLLLEPVEQVMRMLEAVIGEHDDVLAIELHRVRVLGIDQDRAVVTILFLKPRMAVIPVGAALDDRKFVGEGRARRNAGKADARNTVHLKRHQQAVPVDRGFLVQVVDDMKAHILPFP